MALHELANQIFYGILYQPLGCPGSLGRKSAAHHTTPTTLAFKNHRDGFLEKRALQYTATAELSYSITKPTDKEFVLMIQQI